MRLRLSRTADVFGCAAKTGLGAIRCALELPELGLADGMPAVELRAVELEPLPAVARFVTQLLSVGRGHGISLGLRRAIAEASA